MAFKYTGKSLTDKEVEQALKRMELKPKNVYRISKKTGNFIKIKKKKRR